MTLVSDSAVDEQPEMGEIDVRNDTAGILFSSGTTGYPKAIPYSHAMIWERRSRLLKPKYKSVKNPEIVWRHEKSKKKKKTMEDDAANQKGIEKLQSTIDKKLKCSHSEKLVKNKYLALFDKRLKC